MSDQESRAPEELGGRNTLAAGCGLDRGALFLVEAQADDFARQVRSALLAFTRSITRSRLAA